MKESRWIWVTGASSGIGAALARRLLADGNRVIVTARSEQKLADVVKDYPERGFVLPADLTDREGLQDITERLRAFTPRLDAVVINAGTCEYIDIQNFDAQLFEPVMAVNVLGSANTVEVALPFLRNTSRGARVVGVASMVTRLPLTRSEVYGASKAAMEYFMESLRVDLAPEKIGVTLVRPGFVKTPLTDRNDFEMPFLQDPETAAAHIARGLYHGRDVVQFPWQLVWVMRVIGWLPKGIQTHLLKKMVKR